MPRTLGPALLAAAFVLAPPARAADVDTSIPLSTLDAALLVAGPISGGGSYTSVVSRCTVFRCSYAYVSLPWSWKVASARFTSTGALDVVVTLAAGNYSVARRLTVPVAAQVLENGARVQLTPQSTPISVVFPGAVGSTSLDVAPRLTLSLPIRLSPFSAFGRTLTPSLTHVTAAWVSSTLKVSGDVDAF